MRMTNKKISRFTVRRATKSGCMWNIGIILVLIVAAAVYFAAIRKDLPYLTHWDESTFVRPAVRIASTNDLNPRWFSHPGSTIIYPLAVLYRFSSFADEEGLIFSPPPKIQDRFENNSNSFYLSGRILITLFTLAGIYIAYLTGRMIGGGGMGVLAAWFIFLSPMIMNYASLVRTDSASLFFTLAAVYMFFRLCSFQRLVDHLLAGATVGLAIATKYSLGPLVFVLMAVELVLIIKDSRITSAGKTVKNALFGLTAVPVAFLLATPYFLFELETVLENLRSEMRSEHLGQDGLTRWGNLWWYLGQEIPRDMGWARLTAALAGVAVGIFKRDHRVLLCAGTVLALLLGISSSALHWGRWLIPILPLLYLLSADGVVSGVGELRRIGIKGFGNAAILIAVVIAVSYSPVCRIFQLIRISRNYSTRVLAIKWLEENIPPGSCLAQEWMTLQDYPVKNLRVLHELYLSNNTVEYYANSGCRYLLANSKTYGNFLSDPKRYPQEAAFYRRLFKEVECLAEFVPSQYISGPTIRVYRLPPASD